MESIVRLGRSFHLNLGFPSHQRTMTPHPRDLDRRRAQAPAPTPTTLLNRKRASPTFAEPDSVITLPATIAQSYASRYAQIHNQRDSATRLPATNFEVQVDFNRGLWGFCGDKEDDAGRCFMPGVCYDEDKCKDGCSVGGVKNPSTASW